MARGQGAGGEGNLLLVNSETGLFLKCKVLLRRECRPASERMFSAERAEFHPWLEAVVMTEVE